MIVTILIFYTIGVDCARNTKIKHRNQQLKLNMFVASLFQLHIAITYSVVYSSIYLFITSSVDCLEQLSCGPQHNSSDVQVRNYRYETLNCCGNIANILLLW